MITEGQRDPAIPVAQRPCSRCGQLCNVDVCARCAALSSNPVTAALMVFSHPIILERWSW